MRPSIAVVAQSNYIRPRNYQVRTDERQLGNIAYRLRA